MKKIVLTGGGTAGHVTPNLALLPSLQERGYEIHYIGSYNGIEKKLIEGAGIPYDGISSGKLRRYFDIKNFSDPFRVIKGYAEARALLKKYRPDVIFSKGGFVSVPVVLAAKHFKIPTIIHESDMTPGLANKICIPSAAKVCCNFPETLQYLPEDKAVLTGSPIRRELLQGDRLTGLNFTGLSAAKPIIMVIGGSLGDEDHLGDMDFKVTGTKDGITATQMDIKVDGLSYDILERALNQAKEGRMHILNKITETIAEPRADLKEHAPRIETMTIPKEFIGAVIGPGGKIIQGMQEETGAVITIEEIDGMGRIEVSGTNKKCIDDAMRMIKAIVAVPEVGEVYKGKVRSIMPYGAFIEFLPGKDGLLHISEIDWKRLETVEEAGIKEGDEIEVKLIDIDPKTGKFKLSRKVLLPRPEKK